MSEPVWTPDGRRVIQSWGNRPFGGLLSQVADGSRAPDTLLALKDGDSWPTSISTAGAWLAYYGSSLGSADNNFLTDPGDLYFMKLDSKEVQRFPLPGFQKGGRFSPDMRWVAYESGESGRTEVHVRPWPALDANYVVSKGGGTEPVWSPDSRTIYFRNRDRMKAASVLPSDGAFSPGPIRTLFTGTFRHDLYGDQSYDLARDGRFLLLRPVTGGRPLVQVALNWIAEVRARVERGQ